MSLLSSIFNLFTKSDFFSKILVIGLFILGIAVFILFFYGILRFYYKKAEIQSVLHLLKNEKLINGKENNFSKILFYSKNKINGESLFFSLINGFLSTELKMKNFFGISAAISPLLGLLGTIWGIMHVFLNLGSGFADLAIIAPGIAEALITTLAGLFVAIPGLIAYHIFNYNIKNYLLLCQTVYEEIVAHDKMENKEDIN